MRQLHLGKKKQWVWLVLAAGPVLFASRTWSQEQTAPAAQAPPAESPAAPAPDAAAPSQAPSAEPLPTIPVQELSTKKEELPKVAAEPAGSQKFEEVIVTAQRFKQSTRDVPISLSVLSEKFVAQRGIVDIVQAMQYVPNVKISSAGFFAAPQARGFSFNNLNLAFESPLGIAFDGIPYQSTTYFNAGLFDIDRIEVLRGPQGTTFGKNTTAGLVQVVSADPTSQFTGKVSGQLGQLGRKHAELAFGGPLFGDAVEFRIAALEDRREGFIRNTTADIVPGATPRLAGFTHRGLRAKLKFPNIFGSDLKLSYEIATLNSLGTGAELWHVTPTVAAVFRSYDPNVQLDKGFDVNSEDYPDNRLAKTKTFVGEWNRSFGSWDVTLLGGRSVLTESFQFDVDFSPAPAITAGLTDSFPTTTSELRTKSLNIDGLFGLNHIFGLDLGHTDFLGGVFFQRGAIKDSALVFDINLVPYLELDAASIVDANAPQGGGAVGMVPVVMIPGGPPGNHHVFNQNFDQSDRTIAVYQQTEWKFLPQWAIQAGLRISNEKKTGRFHLFYDSGSPDPVLTSLGITEFMADKTLSETQYLPKVSLNYRPNKSVSVFAHWARGFKAGGFNAFAYRDDGDELLFKPETTTEIGIDIKTSYLGGVIRPNISIYRMDARDFQVLGRQKPPVTTLPGPVGTVCPPGAPACVPPTVIGLGTTRVFNAPKAIAQGVEGDISWIPFRNANVFATIGFNDTKYVDFKKNECSADNMATNCDATGKQFAFAPRWDSTITPSYTLALPWGLAITPSFTVQYIGSQYLDTDLEQRKRQPGFLRYNADIGIGNAAQGWSLSVIGRNLTDKKTFIRYGDLIPNTFIAVPESPREIFAQLRYTF